VPRVTCQLGEWAGENETRADTRMASRVLKRQEVKHGQATASAGL
jgi:hypothetical protein